MAVLKCKMCGGTVDFTPGETVGVCEFCGTKQTIPKANDEVITNLFNRANNLRLKCEFDKAEQIYEKIVQQDDSEAEAHWGIILCKYGIEYVEDPKTFERVPTCHRTRFESIKTDADYEAAIDYSDMLQQSIYEKEAREIDKLQKDILTVVKNEKPYDVFICYKETDDSGKRTVDSTLANDIYYQLTQNGLKVFFAAITLEDKLGHEYEPYIFAALNSAKVMLIIGTKPEYFTAVWVKNEWSRFMNLMKTDRSKILIPCYRDMDAYDLPEEFAHLQAQDMSRIGFIQDIIRGVEKVVGKETKAQGTTVGVGAAAWPNVDALLKRAYIFLEDGNWQEANAYCERVLDNDPENAQAYLGKLLAELKVKSSSDLVHCARPFSDNKNYHKAIRFGDERLRSELNGYIDAIQKRIADRERDIEKYKIYEEATDLLYSDYSEHAYITYMRSAQLLSSIDGYKDANQLSKLALERAAEAREKDRLKKEEEEVARKKLCYNKAIEQMNEAITEEQYNVAAEAFEGLPGFEDADELAEKCLKEAEKAKLWIAAISDAILAGPDASVRTTGEIIAESKKREALLERLLESFKDINNSIADKKAGLQYTDARIQSLNAQRERLGILAGKEKKAIDFEIANLKEDKNRKTLEIEQLNNQLQGYSNDAQIEIDLIHLKESIKVLEEKQSEEQKYGITQYSFTEAREVFEGNLVVRNAICEKRPNLSFAIADCGDTVMFGAYPQSSRRGNEPIEWQILAKEGGRCLVISRYALDVKSYNYGSAALQKEGATWNTCTLRGWLNGEFYKKAFSRAEQAVIALSTVKADPNPKNGINPGNDTTDKVFILGISEATKYFGSKDERKCPKTSFCIDKGGPFNNNSAFWWLRSPGKDSHYAAFVDDNGSINYKGQISSKNCAVRPALWISMKE